MDCSDEGSDSELGATGCLTGDFLSYQDNSSSSSKSNILRPQIDRIFSEVQKNLPNIDFDSSDVSSDNDEPIFFHQNLKLSSLNAAFDDDKDLDTSLSQGDFPTSRLGVSAHVKENSTEEADGEERRNTARGGNISGNRDADGSIADAYEASLGSSYDNDLAALMMQVKFPSAEDVVSWQKISLKREEEEDEMNRREEEDLERHIQGHRKLSSGAEHTSTAHVGVGASDNEDREVDIEEVNLQTDLDRKRLKNKPDFSVTERSFQDRLQQGALKDLAGLGPQEKKQAMRERARTKDQEIVSTLNPNQQTMLNFRMFEELDLDSILSAANESNIPLDSLRVVGQPRDSQIPKSHDGGGDTKGTKGQGTELTLMQKLAQLSMAQRGADVTPATRLDPKTGASLLPADDARLIYNQTDTRRSKGMDQVKAVDLVKKSRTSSCGTGPELGMHVASQTGRSKRCFKTPTTTAISPYSIKLFLLHGLGLYFFVSLSTCMLICLSHIPSFFLSVCFSSDDDEEEMVERCDWRKTRLQLKQNLSQRGAGAAARILGSSGNRKTESGKTSYVKPPRVINLKEHAASRKWARKPDQDAPVAEETSAEHDEATRRQEEDNKILQEKLDAEKEKTRQREEARRLREEREKERERRIRMSKQIEAARSTASTQGKQDAGENTPALFDTEVSYEPVAPPLPPDLPAERETLLLTVHLSSNGEIVQHRRRSNRSVDAGSGLSATYTALLSWLLSLVPHDFSFLAASKQGESTGSSSADAGSASPPDLSVASTFNVLGLQQTWQDEELKLNVVVTPSQSYLRGVAAPRQGARSVKGKNNQMKGGSKFSQHLSKFLTVNTLYTVGPWLDNLVSVVLKSEKPEDKSAAPFHYTPPLPDISTKPLSTFIQINQDPQAARKIFLVPVGFYWQTVDSGDPWHAGLDCRDSHVCYETQNTMSLVYNQIFHSPTALMAILNRAAQ
ncbi:hypothetical protein EGW08_002198, partial [Elysia chlorotica]